MLRKVPTSADSTPKSRLSTTLRCTCRASAQSAIRTPTCSSFWKRPEPTPDAATATLEEALELDPRSGRILEALAHMGRRAGWYAEAEAPYERARADLVDLLLVSCDFDDAPVLRGLRRSCRSYRGTARAGHCVAQPASRLGFGARDRSSLGSVARSSAVSGAAGQGQELTRRFGACGEPLVRAG